MTTTDPFDTPGAPPAQPTAAGPKRDRYGRYLLPDLGNGKERPWTRATTWAKSCADTTALAKWQQRMVAKGIANRSDLYALASATDVEDRKTFDQLCQDAMEAAGSATGRNQGTALHSFTERVDRGEQVDVPAQWRDDVNAYQQAMTRSGLTVRPEWIERITVVRDLGVAGTFDRVVLRPNGQPVVFDLKTGQKLDYSWGEISIQLALYANADAIWNDHTGEYEPMPDNIDRQHAIVAHLPVGQSRCDLYELDIAAGWEMAQVCGTVRTWRTRRDLAGRYTLPAPAAPTGLLDQIEKAATEKALTELWQQAFTAGQWTDQHTAAARARKAALTS